MADVSRAAACVPSFFPLHELGYSEELVTLNFRGLGTRYCPVLLWFGLLLLGGVALHSAALVAIDRHRPELVRTRVLRRS